MEKEKMLICVASTESPEYSTLYLVNMETYHNEWKPVIRRKPIMVWREEEEKRIDVYDMYESWTREIGALELKYNHTKQPLLDAEVKGDFKLFVCVTY